MCFTGLRHGLPRIPPATPSARLRTKRIAGIIDDGYQITEAGTALAPVLRELARWAARQPGVLVRGDQDLQRQMYRWFKRYVFTPDALSATSP